MEILTRRTAIAKVLGISAGLAVTHDWRAVAEANPTRVLKATNATPVEIPANFTGLGFEMSSIAAPDLLSPTNNRYANLVRGLGPKGVLRAGGIVANYTRYVPDGAAEHDRKNTVIARACLERFNAFLREVGWSAIWSVNFAQGTIEEAVNEAQAVFEILGPNLLALEIGNEVDSYGKGQPFRPASYDFGAYLTEYQAWHGAISKAVPGIRFAAPDTARTGNWVEQMAREGKGQVQLLTTHYYRNGERRGSAGQLLTPDPRLKEELTLLRDASQRSGIPWRMCEINSFSGGGLPGVSDTFADTLWTLNTMLLAAQYGCAGVNMETGVNQLGFVSSYSPIQDDGDGKNSAGAPYYGMLAFATAFAGCHQSMPLEPGDETESVHAYVLGARGKPRSVTIVNMASTSDAHVGFESLGTKHANVLRLVAPSAGSKSGVTFGAATVDETGRWRPRSHERAGNGQVHVPPMSAAVLLLERA